MPVNRSLYVQAIYKSSFPSWQCGCCGAGTLQLVKNSLESFQTAESRKARQHPDWDPEWIEFRFVCLAKCTSDACGEIATVTGTGETLLCFDEDPRTYQTIERWEERYAPRFICPATRLFVISEDIPDATTTELRRAFELFWVDRSACVNTLRAALEVALDDLKINKFKIKKGKGKSRRLRLSLHERIERLPAKYSSVRQSLTAAKWIGNAGSHGQSINTDDAFDALDLVEHSLNGLFDKSSQKLASLAKRVSAKRGPLGGVH